MNDSRFAFSHQPFPALPRIEQYVDVGSSDFIRKQCLESIRRNAGPSVILGGPGLGKTMTCMRIVQSCANIAETVLLSSSQIASRADLLKCILYELRMPYRGLFDGELRLSLIERLQHRRSPSSEKVLIVVDEAQAISPRLLEELRLLTNLTSNGQPCISLILCGSLKLEEMLSHVQLESLNQRITARHFLRPLNHSECQEYIRHRIELAGVVADQVFDDSAIDAIFLVSNGVPRLIDQIADKTMSMDVHDGMRPLNAKDVERAWQTHHQATPPWTDNAAISVSDISASRVQEYAQPELEITYGYQPEELLEVSYEKVAKNEEIPLSFVNTSLSEVSHTNAKADLFKDADLSGWTEGDFSTSNSNEYATAKVRPATPPSAGMGLSSALPRDSQSSSHDRVHELEESLNQFDYRAVTRAIHGGQSAPNSAGGVSNANNQKFAIQDQYVEHVPLDVQDLHNVNVGYGHSNPELSNAFDLQPPVNIGAHSIEEDLFDMISNINMESISIDPFLDFDSTNQTSSFVTEEEQVVGNHRHDFTSEIHPAHNRIKKVESAPQSFFSQIIDEGKDYIDVQLTGGNLFEDDLPAENSRLRERLGDLDDIAAAARHNTQAFALSEMEPATITIPMDDRDMIIVEEEIGSEDQVGMTTPNAPVAKALLQSYSKLFQDLRAS